MKKRMALLAVIFTLGFSEMTAWAATGQGTGESQDVTELVQEYQEKIKDMIGDMDENEVNQAFTFLKEKAADGGLKTEEDVKNAVQEGKEKFGIEVEDKYVEEMLELVNTLEDMGFNSEAFIGKAETMYQEYGADFVDHTQEIVVEAVKDSIGTIIKNAIMDFFNTLGESIKNFFANLF